MTSQLRDPRTGTAQTAQRRAILAKRPAVAKSDCPILPSDASGLFNLMRNLGGAIGIALIDTILYGRTGGHAEALRDRLVAGDITAAQAIGLDLKLFLHRPPDVSEASVEAYLRPMVERAAFALSANEAWALLAGVALLGLLLVPLAGGLPDRRDPDAAAR
jgi:DHA2 family multidrug resistance protein